MVGLYEQFFELLGKSSEHDLVNSVLQRHCRDRESQSLRIYSFDDLGIELVYSTKFHCFCGLCFDYGSRSVKGGAIKPFTEAVIAGVCVGDRPVDVACKLGRSPSKTSAGQHQSADVRARIESEKEDLAYFEHYELPPYRFTFVYDSIEGEISLLGIADPRFFQTVSVRSISWLDGIDGSMFICSMFYGDEPG